jgi:hypothetical protein
LSIASVLGDVGVCGLSKRLVGEFLDRFPAHKVVAIGLRDLSEQGLVGEFLDGRLADGPIAVFPLGPKEVSEGHVPPLARR